MKSLLPLKWGFISTARINHALMEPLHTSERNTLLGIASRSLDKARKYADQRNIPRAYGSYLAMLDDPEIAVVYNSLPNSLHAEWTVRALKAGKHVLCEKPLATSVEEVDDMRIAAIQTGMVLAEAFMYRHHPQTLKVKEIVDSGAIGIIRLIKGAFTFNLTRSSDVRLDPALGGGSVWDVGCYPISFTRFILGSEPLEVFGWQKTGNSGVDEVFSGQLKFENDVLAQFDCGFRSLPRARMVIIGSEGTLVVQNPFKPGIEEEIKIYREKEVQSIKVPGQELYIGEVEDMADAIILGKQNRISLEDSRANVAAIQALLRSAKEGIPVKIE